MTKQKKHLRRSKKGKVFRAGSKVTVRPRDRRILNEISNPDKFKREYGGHLDFNKKGKIEYMTLTSGNSDTVELPADFEVLYHTHPSHFPSPPSPEDIEALVTSPKQKAELVIQKGNIYTIIKTPKSQSLSKIPLSKLRKKLDKAFYETIGPRWVPDYVKELRKMGFKVSYNKKSNKSMDIKIKPVEPKKHQRWRL